MTKVKSKNKDVVLVLTCDGTKYKIEADTIGEAIAKFPIIQAKSKVFVNIAVEGKNALTMIHPNRYKKLLVNKIFQTVLGKYLTMVLLLFSVTKILSPIMPCFKHILSSLSSSVLLRKAVPAGIDSSHCFSNEE